MKKILLLVILGIFFFGCNVEDDNPETLQQVLVPITFVEMPDSFILGNTYSIKLKYIRPTACHHFSGISYELDGKEQYFGVLNSFDVNNPNCTEIEGLTGETSFEFTANKDILYIFKFWQGIDEDGKEIYMEKEVSVSKSGEET